MVSPEPDVNTMTIDVSRHRCLILGTDGLWNMIPPQRAVEVVQAIDRQNKMHAASDQPMVIFLINGSVFVTYSNSLLVAVDQPVEAFSKHSFRLLADEQTASGQLHGRNCTLRPTRTAPFRIASMAKVGSTKQGGCSSSFRLCNRFR